MPPIDKKTFIKYTSILAIIIIGFLLDLWSKRWAVAVLSPQQTPLILIPGLLELDFTQNHGMVFGIFNNGSTDITKIILTSIRSLILIGVVVFTIIKRKEPFLFLLPFALILAGAGGNVLDGLTTGYVVDFIHIHAGTLLDWPFLFNVADVYLVIGMALLLIFGNLIYPKEEHAHENTDN